MHRRSSVLLSLLILAGPLWAEEEAWDITQILGMTPPQVVEILGSPSEIYTLKVTETQWQPVLFYPRNIYLFLHQNRVWQIRMDKRYDQDFQGVKTGMPKGEVLRILGTPLGEDPLWLVYNMSYNSFPRRMRLIFTEEKLSDIFVYRSDF